LKAFEFYSINIELLASLFLSCFSILRNLKCCKCMLSTQ